jgi:hypothetical protein
MKTRDQTLLEEAYLKVKRRKAPESLYDYNVVVDYIENGCKGDLTINGSYLTKLPEELHSVEGDFQMMSSSIKYLPKNLKYIGGNFHLMESYVQFLPDDLTVGKDLSLFKSEKIKILPKNLKVGEDLILHQSSITSLNQFSPGIEVKGYIYSDDFTSEEAKAHIKELNKISKMEQKLPEIEGIFK